MGYVTLYRKWRPQTFEDVVGQEHIVRTLTNALRDNRVAHAYLFSGPRGTGKTSIAKILAKALNCADGPTATPCNKCSACVEITAGSGLDVIEIDAASNRGIDEIRDIREKVKFMPAGGGTKVYIIDEVHMLTPEAFNALLKMLEEPPSHVVFILATTEPHKVLPTILSRCQRFDFRRLKTDELAGRLNQIATVEGIDIDEPSIALIAKQAKGGMRDAVSTLDQLSSYTGSVIRSDDVMAMLGMVDSNLLFRLAGIINERDAGAALVFINEIVESGWDLRQFAKDLTEHFRNLFVIRNTENPGDGVIATAEELVRLEAQAGGFAPAELMAAIEALTALNNDLRFASDPRLILELALVKMTAKPEGVSLKAEDKKPETKTETTVPITETAAGPKPEPASRRSVIARSGSDLPAGRQAKQPHQATSAKPGPGNEIETIKRAWPAVLEKIKKTKMSTFANLLECRPVAVEGNVVVLEFHDRASGHKERISTDANKPFVEGVIRDITGKPYVIKCVLGEKQGPASAEVASDEIAAGEVASSPKAQAPRNDAERSAPEPETEKPRAAAPQPSPEALAPHASRLAPNEDSSDIPPLPTSEHASAPDEIAASPKEQAPRNDRMTRSNEAAKKPHEKTASDSGQDMLATLTGMFDATVKETKERP